MMIHLLVQFVSTSACNLRAQYDDFSDGVAPVFLVEKVVVLVRYKKL